MIEIILLCCNCAGIVGFSEFFLFYLFCWFEFVYIICFWIFSLMKIGKTLYVTNRRSWRAWLRKNYKKEKEIWLIYYKKASGKARIAYDAAVEEALCYGWIDSTAKSIDEQRFAQRFTPRKKTSVLSPSNIERIKKLIKQKKMTRAGLKAVEHAFDPAKIRKNSKLVVPDYILRALKKNPEALSNFQKMPQSYKRIRIAYIEAVRKHGTKLFRAALKNFISKAEKNKRFGMIRK